MNPKNESILYVTREIERALGVVPNEKYRILSNKTQYGEQIKNKFPDFVTLLENTNGELLGTTELLNHSLTRQLINQLSETGPVNILVFKNTMRVESVIKANGWKVLNPVSTLSERIENKISQIRWLNNLGLKYLPPHSVKVCRNILWKNNEPFILQWAHGHTGDGTFLIHTKDELIALQEKFPDRMARVTAYVNGPSFTLNAVITSDRIIMGNISYQITGLPPFTDNEFSTIGNDWSAAKKILTNVDFQAIESITAEIGQKMQSEGWRGLFGVDVIKDENRGRFYLIEINARQPASSTFESSLQEIARDKGAKGLTTFETHLRSLLNLPVDQDIIRIDDGAQIIQRITKTVQDVFDDVITSLQNVGYKVISYKNTAYNSDLLRIQSQNGIINAHKMFNEKGKEIISIIKNSQFKFQV